MSSNYEFRSITYIIASQPMEGSGGMKVECISDKEEFVQ